MGTWREKHIPSLIDVMMCLSALAPSLVRFELGNVRVPQVGTEQTRLRGKGVASGESWGVAPGLCQTGSHWHNWKSHLGAWMAGGKGAECLGAAAAGVAQGKA